jgi:hypothetical protein
MLLLFLELAFLLIIPIQPVLNFFQSALINTPYDIRFNFIIYLGSQGYYIYITETINVLLALSTILFLISFIRFNKAKELSRYSTRPIYSIISAALLINGRILFSPFFALQLLSVRCYFQTDACSE